MVNYKGIVLKGNYKEKCQVFHKDTTFSYKRNVSLDLRAFHFWLREGGENDKLQNDSPQRRQKEKCPGFHKDTIFFYKNNVFLDLEAFHVWPSEGSGNSELKKYSPQRQLQR